jgi:hypothetical protein
MAFAIWEKRRELAMSKHGIELEAWGDGSLPSANGVYEEASAALAAMEQPSQKMIDAGNACDDEGSPNDGDFGHTATAVEHWRAMITAELKPDDELND